MIRFDSVTKTYPDGTVAVDELDLDVAVRADHGARRSVRLRQDHLPAHDQPDDRADVAAASGSTTRTPADGRPAELRRGIGYVIQHAGLFPHRTVVDNVATVPLLLGGQASRRGRRRWSCWSGSGCRPSFAKRYPAQLSGGQQQRVGVARALAADPPVMLMDEPFSAVDPVVREQLQDEFLRLQSELGKTIVFVTHDIDEAIKLGDQVAVLRVGGKLAQLATPAELLADPVDDFVAGFVGATAATARSASNRGPAATRPETDRC